MGTRNIERKMKMTNSFASSPKYMLTSESVTEGHPDKLCDQISDAKLDTIMAEDPNGRVACETAVTTGLVIVMGEITTSCYVDVPRVVRQVVKDIGYTWYLAEGTTKSGFHEPIFYQSHVF